MRSLVLPPFLLLLAAPAAAETRNLSITSFDRIRVDGPYHVRLTTNVSPFATLSGDVGAMDGVSIDVQGRTLVVHRNPSSWGGYPGGTRGPVEISVGTHDLGAAFVNGSGSLDIDRVAGLGFELSVQGAGSATIDKVEVDQFRLGIVGAASARLSGRAPRLTAIVRGTSSLDAGALESRDATIGADGPSIVKVQVTGTAKVDARGTATVTIAGNPACTVKAEGSASIEGCR